jgi:hypothetical protein
VQPPSSRSKTGLAPVWGMNSPVKANASDRFKQPNGTCSGAPVSDVLLAMAARNAAAECCTSARWLRLNTA